MLSSTHAMPQCSATARPNRLLAPDDSRSGNSRPNTRCGPSACAASAAHTELSTPPDNATTTPRRRKSRATMPCRRSPIRFTSATVSRRNTLASSLLADTDATYVWSIRWTSLRLRQLRVYVTFDIGEAVEVLRDHFLVENFNIERFLQKRNQLDDAGGIEHADRQK